MRLYHYTSEQHMSLIRKTGSISKCVIPWNMVNERPTFVTGFQWLTESDDWLQPWANTGLFSKLPYRRTEFRITIDLPNTSGTHLYHWLVFCSKHTFEGKHHVNAGNDPHNWRLFKGRIPTTWFEAIDRNPIPLVLNLDEPNN